MSVQPIWLSAFTPVIVWTGSFIIRYVYGVAALMIH